MFANSVQRVEKLKSKHRREMFRAISDCHESYRKSHPNYPNYIDSARFTDNLLKHHMDKIYLLKTKPDLAFLNIILTLLVEEFKTPEIASPVVYAGWLKKIPMHKGYIRLLDSFIKAYSAIYQWRRQAEWSHNHSSEFALACAVELVTTVEIEKLQKNIDLLAERFKWPGHSYIAEEFIDTFCTKSVQYRP